MDLAARYTVSSSRAEPLLPLQLPVKVGQRAWKVAGVTGHRKVTKKS